MGLEGEAVSPCLRGAHPESLSGPSLSMLETCPQVEQSLGSGARLPEFKSWLYHFLCDLGQIT